MARPHCTTCRHGMTELGHSRRRQPRALFDPLPQCPESGLRVGALVSVAKGHEETRAAHKSRACIGRTERGFDFLGHHFSPAGLTVAAKTIANFIEKASQLYEQERSAVLAVTALEMYVRRWLRWAMCGRLRVGKDFLHVCRIGRCSHVGMDGPTSPGCRLITRSGARFGQQEVEHDDHGNRSRSG
jgi:hypothetical protein